MLAEDFNETQTRKARKCAFKEITSYTLSEKERLTAQCALQRRPLSGAASSDFSTEGNMNVKYTLLTFHKRNVSFCPPTSN
jgi:hypothetical protein